MRTEATPTALTPQAPQRLMHVRVAACRRALATGRLAPVTSAALLLGRLLPLRSSPPLRRRIFAVVKSVTAAGGSSADPGGRKLKARYGRCTTRAASWPATPRSAKLALELGHRCFRCLLAGERWHGAGPNYKTRPQEGPGSGAVRLGEAREQHIDGLPDQFGDGLAHRGESGLA